MGIVKLRKAQPYNLKINDMGLKIGIGKLILGSGGGSASTSSGLDLLFDNIANANIMIGGSSSNVSDWNTFFDLPVKGTPFTSVTVTGNKVTLFGGSGITFRDYVFGDNVPTEDCLLEVVDNVGCIIACEDGVFSDCNTGFGCYGITKIHLSACVTLGKEVFADCLVLVDLNLPLTSYTALGDYCFQNCAELINLNFSSLISAGDGCFSNCSGLVSPDFSSLISAGVSCFEHCTELINLDLSSCTSLGTTTGNDNVFRFIIGNIITLTVPVALMICNGGAPDGDIAYLQANNTVTVIQV